MIRGVVFDLDYTLAVPDRDRAELLDDAAQSAGAPALSRDAYLDAHRQNLTSETREPIFETLLADRETDAEPAALARAYRETIADALVRIDGIEGMLENLRRQYRVGLLTNGPVTAQRDKLTTLDLEGAFDAILVTGELEAGKPDQRAFDAILAELAVEPEHAVYIGDEITADIVGATNAGMQAVQVLFEDGPDPDPRAVAHVDQAKIATQLPVVLDDLD